MKHRVRVAKRKLTLSRVSSAPGSPLHCSQEMACRKNAGAREAVPGEKSGRRPGPWEKLGNGRGAKRERPRAGPKGRPCLRANHEGDGENRLRGGTRAELQLEGAGPELDHACLLTAGEKTKSRRGRGVVGAAVKQPDAGRVRGSSCAVFETI